MDHQLRFTYVRATGNAKRCSSRHAGDGVAREKALIDADRPLVVVGVSNGAFVAAALAEEMGADAVRGASALPCPCENHMELQLSLFLRCRERRNGGRLQLDVKFAQDAEVHDPAGRVP